MKITVTSIIVVLFIGTLIMFAHTLSSYTEIKNQYIYNTHYLDNLSYFREQLNKLEKDIENAPKKIIPLTPILILNHCSKIAESLNMDIISYNPVNILKQENTGYKDISIELNIKTGYPALINFINKMENLDYVTEIKKLEIYRIEPYSSKIKCKLIISGYTVNEEQ